MTSSISDVPQLYKSPEGYAIMTRFYDESLAALPVTVESRYIDTPYGETHMLVAGPDDAPPLVLIQGMAGSSILWHRQLADFTRHHRIYALDTPGQPGRSAPQPLNLFDDSYARWLLAVLDGLGLERADMAGVSLGASVLVQLAASNPERIRRAVLLSPMGLSRGRLNIRRYIGNGMRGDRDGDRLEDRLTVREFVDSDPDRPRQQFDRQLARAMALATRHYRLDLAMGIRVEQSRFGKLWSGLRLLMKLNWPVPDQQLAAIEADALLILGEHEMLYDSTRAAQRMRRINPHVKVHIVTGAGHAAIYDRPELVNPVILDYLEAE